MERNGKKQTVVVIGAGLTGLTTAYWLRRSGIDVHVIERQQRIGGQIQTHRHGDFVFESGPTTGSISTPEVAELMAEYGGGGHRNAGTCQVPHNDADKVLKDMHRPYDTKRFATLLEQIRKKVPGIAVTTDVIVGFPGETEEEFAATCDFVKQCGFAKMHVFPYSKRKGTPAAARQDQIPEKVKKKRAENLAELDREMQQAYFVENIGKAHTVLVEQVVSKTTAGSGADNSEALLVEGLTENYIRVELPGNADLCGKVVDVKITEALIDKCKGRIL